MSYASGDWLTFLVCGGGVLIVTVVAAVLGTRSRLKFAKQIMINQKNGLYRNPELGKQLWELILLQCLMLIALAVGIALAIMTKSSVAAIAAGVALVILVICVVRWNRLMAKGGK